MHAGVVAVVAHEGLENRKAAVDVSVVVEARSDVPAQLRIKAIAVGGMGQGPGRKQQRHRPGDAQAQCSPSIAPRKGAAKPFIEIPNTAIQAQLATLKGELETSKSKLQEAGGNDGQLKKEVESLEKEIKKLEPRAKTQVMVMQELPERRPTYLLKRGDYRHPDKSEALSPALPALFEKLPDGALTGPLRQVSPDATLFTFPEVARYLIREGCEIVIQRDPGAGDAEVCLGLLGTCVAVLLHQRGILPLHASGIHTNRGAG